MTPTNYLLAGADLVAITALVAVFLGRHGRRDLVVAFLGVNVGVLAVATALGTGTIGAGLGLGLFGVLSIIRLRSEELTQSEIAYYFGALALGLLGSIGTADLALSGGLMALVVGAIWVGDHPSVTRRTVSEEIKLDRALTDPVAVRAHVESLVGEVDSVTVVRTDLVDDCTLVRVRRPVLDPVSAGPGAIRSEVAR